MDIMYLASGIVSVFISSILRYDLLFYLGLLFFAGAIVQMIIDINKK